LCELSIAGGDRGATGEPAWLFVVELAIAAFLIALTGAFALSELAIV
jgi:hypothetical protein